MLRACMILILLAVAPNFVFAQSVNPARQAAQQRGTQAPADGIWYVYDRQGNLSKIENYMAYRLAGEVKSFYSSGAIKARTTYIDGNRQGKESTYFEKGGLQGENFYVDNNLNGDSRQYYEQGGLYKASNYLNGQLDGETKIYYKSGALQQVWNYKLGVISGTALDYSEDGQVKSEDIYVNGVIVSHKDYKSDIASFTSAPKPKPVVADNKTQKPTEKPPVAPSKP